MTTVAAIKGKMGDINYYQCTMKTKDVISRTECATEFLAKKIGPKWVLMVKCKESQAKDI